MTPEQPLLTRPTFEQASKDYLAMLTEMQKAISSVALSLRWRRVPYQDGSSLCEPPYSKIKGATHAAFASGNADGAIPDADWPAVVKAVAGIAAQHRFTRQQALVDKPGDHTLVIHDSWGGTVELGTEKNTVLTVYSPCLLTENARDRISRSTSPSSS